MRKGRDRMTTRRRKKKNVGLSNLERAGETGKTQNLTGFYTKPAKERENDTERVVHRLVVASQPVATSRIGKSAKGRRRPEAEPQNVQSCQKKKEHKEI